MDMWKSPDVWAEENWVVVGRCSYLWGIITGILAAGWVCECCRRHLGFFFLRGGFGIWICKLVVTSSRKLVFEASIKSHLTQIVTDAIYQHTRVTGTAWSRAVMNVAFLGFHALWRNMWASDSVTAVNDTAITKPLNTPVSSQETWMSSYSTWKW